MQGSKEYLPLTRTFFPLNASRKLRYFQSYWPVIRSWLCLNFTTSRNDLRSQTVIVIRDPDRRSDQWEVVIARNSLFVPLDALAPDEMVAMEIYRNLSTYVEMVSSCTPWLIRCLSQLLMMFVLNLKWVRHSHVGRMAQGGPRRCHGLQIAHLLM